MQNNGLNRDYFRAVERALYDFPGNKALLRQRENYIETLCAGSNCADIIQMGACSTKPVTAIQERTVIKNDDDMMCRVLRAKIQPIQEAYNTMHDGLKDLVRLRYWQGLSIGEVMAELDISERVFYRLRRRAVRHVAPFVVGAWGM